jgi:hypothetical protein
MMKRIKPLQREDGTLILPPYVDFREDGAVAPWDRRIPRKQATPDPRAFFDQAARMRNYQKEISRTTSLVFKVLGVAFIYGVVFVSCVGFVQW